MRQLSRSDGVGFRRGGLRYPPSADHVEMVAAGDALQPVRLGFNFFGIVKKAAAQLVFDVLSKIGEVPVAIVQISLNGA